MAKNWYNYWLEPEENYGSHNSKAARARQRMRKEAEETRGYPHSGDRYQKKSASNAQVYMNSAASRGYPQSGDKYQKQAAQNAPKTQMKSISQKESNRVSGGEMMKATQAAKNVNALRQQGYSAKEAVRKTNRNILHEAFSEANSLSKLKDKIKKR